MRLFNISYNESTPLFETLFILVSTWFDMVMTLIVINTRGKVASYLPSLSLSRLYIYASQINNVIISENTSETKHRVA